jgi:hypothetical protein
MLLVELNVDARRATRDEQPRARAQAGATVSLGSAGLLTRTAMLAIRREIHAAAVAFAEASRATLGGGFADASIAERISAAGVATGATVSGARREPCTVLAAGRCPVAADDASAGHLRLGLVGWAAAHER